MADYSPDDQQQIDQLTLQSTQLQGIVLEEEGDSELKYKRHWLSAPYSCHVDRFFGDISLSCDNLFVPGDKTLQLFSLYHQFF